MNAGSRSHGEETMSPGVIAGGGVTRRVMRLSHRQQLIFTRTPRLSLNAKKGNILRSWSLISNQYAD